MSVSRESARSLSHLAKVAAVALGVGAVAAGLVPATPLVTVPEPDANAGPMLPPAPEVSKGPPRAPDLDLPLLVGVLWEYGNPPADEPAPAVANTPTQPGTQTAGKPDPGTRTPTGEEQPRWRYIGQIVGPRTTHALLERQGLQRLVSAGGDADGTRVIEVHKDYVMLDDGAGPRRVELATAANAWEMVGSGPRAAPATAGTNTRPPSYAQPGRPGAQPMRPPPAVNPSRPGQTTDDMEEMRQKLEELRRQREESGEIGAADPRDGDAAPRPALAHAARGGNAG